MYTACLCMYTCQAAMQRLRFIMLAAVTAAAMNVSQPGHHTVCPFNRCSRQPGVVRSTRRFLYISMEERQNWRLKVPAGLEDPNSSLIKTHDPKMNLQTQSIIHFNPTNTRKHALNLTGCDPPRAAQLSKVWTQWHDSRTTWAPMIVGDRWSSLSHF